MRLGGYGCGVGYGHGGADNEVGVCVFADPDDVTFTNNIAVFDSQGLLILEPGGWVYLRNEDGYCYAVGIRRSGAMLLRKWFEPSGNWG